MDFDGRCYAMGATLLAVGTTGMAQSPTSGVYVAFGTSSRPGGPGGGGPGGGQGGSSLSITSGNSIEIRNSAGAVLYSATAVKTANSVVFVAPGLTSGQTYYLYVNGSQAGTATASGTIITPSVTSVTVSPGTAVLAPGGTQKFTAAVTGTNNPSQLVTWTVNGSAAGTVISSDGTLTVAANETAETLTVRGTSTVDTGKSGTATVTITYPPTAFTVTFDAGGGEASETVMTTGPDGRLASLPDAVRDGYTFLGWYNETGGEVTAGTVFTSDATVAAKWEEIPQMKVSVSTPTIVATLAANLDITVEGAPEGIELKAYLEADGIRLEGSATDIVSGKGLMRVSAAPNAAADCKIVVVGEGVSAECTITLKPYALNLWSPGVGKDGGRLMITFYDDIVLKSGIGCVAIGGISYDARVLEDKRTVEVVTGAASIAEGTVISIKGVKYPDLFPSYSFTFTLLVP